MRWVLWLPLFWVVSAQADEPSAVLLDPAPPFTRLPGALAELWSVEASASFRTNLHLSEWSRPLLAEARPLASGSSVSNELTVSAGASYAKLFAVQLQLPILLSQKVDYDPGDSSAVIEAGQPLFDLPSRGATRSGLTSFAAAVLWNVWAGASTSWQLRASADVSLGRSRIPCLQGQSCPGAARGTHLLRLESRFSFDRQEWAPVVGLAVEQELPSESTLSGRFSFESSVGVATILWLEPARFRRVAFQLLLTGAWSSAGHSPLLSFDLLGTSPHPSLVGVNPWAEQTDHLRGRLEAVLELRAARHMRFEVKVGGMLAGPSELILNCGPSCSADALRALDLPGRRLSQQADQQLHLEIGATALF